MQIVIDIDEELYKKIKKNCYIYEEEVESVALSIIGGTPLPKGHGDLIDRKELLKQPIDTANYPSNYVQIAPTIIEADRSEEE